MRIQIGMYVVFINDLMKTVPRTNVLVIKFEDYAVRRRTILLRLCKFLNLGELPPGTIHLVRTHKRRGEGLNRCA